MDAMIAEAAARGDVDLDLVSVDSIVARAHHHAAGMVVDAELLGELEKAVAEEKGLQTRGKNGAVGEGSEGATDAERGRRRALRRPRRARLKAAELGRSRGGLTSKVHLAADHRCRPLSITLTPGQAADSPRFIPVLEKIKVRGRVGRPRTRPDAAAGEKGVLIPHQPRLPAQTQHQSGYPGESRPERQPKEEGQLGRPPGQPRRHALQGPQHRRANNQQVQGVARAGHPLRQEARELHRRPPPTRIHHLAPQPAGPCMIRTPHRP